MTTDLNCLLNYAVMFLGTPYQYGGKTPMGGIDCSGFVSELLKAGGVLGDSEDLNAQELFNKLAISAIPTGRAGALVFYGSGPKNIHHVAFCIDAVTAIGADGGISTTKTLQDAIAEHAWVKMRPIKSPCYREDVVAIIMPEYP